MSDYLNRQIFLPQEVIVAVKMYCAKKSVETGVVCKMYDFNLDLLDFLKKTKIKKYIDSYASANPTCSSFNIRLPNSVVNLFDLCLRKAQRESGENISERSLLTTGVILLLKKHKLYTKGTLKLVK